MRLAASLSKVVAGLFAVSLVAGLSACSDAKEDDENLKPEGDAAAEAKDGDADQATEIGRAHV